jgi:flagellar hook-basal body complex protein FliE
LRNYEQNGERVGQDYVVEISALKAVVLGTVISVGDLQDILARLPKAIKADKQDTIKVLLIKMGKILKWVLNKNGTLRENAQEENKKLIKKSEKESMKLSETLTKKFKSEMTRLSTVIQVRDKTTELVNYC